MRKQMCFSFLSAAASTAQKPEAITGRPKFGFVRLLSVLAAKVAGEQPEPASVAERQVRLNEVNFRSTELFAAQIPQPGALVEVSVGQIQLRVGTARLKFRSAKVAFDRPKKVAR